VLLTALGLVTVSALSFTEIRRPDMLVYGRYVESIAPPLVAIGLVRLAAAPRRPREAVLVAALILLTACVVVLRSAVEPPDPAGVLNVQALPLRGSLSGRSLLLCGLAAAFVLWVLVLVGRRRPWALVPVALFMFVPTAGAAQNDLRRSSRAIYPSGWSSPAAFVERLGLERVGYDTDGDDDPATRDRGNVLPWQLPRAVVVRFSGRGQPPPTRYVISSASWGRQHPALASKAAWIDRADHRVLWRVAGPAQALRPLEACLRTAGLRFRPDPRSAAGGAGLVVDLRRGRRARVIVHARASDAADAEQSIRRLLRAGGTGARGDVVRRGGTVVIYPTGVGSADRQALSRCLQATPAGTAVR
jgi:hypothetical protein